MMAGATDPERHIAYGDPGAILEEIARLAWAIRVHAEIIERYAGLGHVEGIELAFKHIRACLLQLAELKKGLANEEP